MVSRDHIERPATPARTDARRDAAERVRAHIAQQGLRRSSTRDAVVELFLATPGHTSIEELTARLRDRGIGQATVYRTLKLLEACGVAEARRFTDGVTRYEPVVERSHHDHLICTACGRIVEFECDEIERLQLQVARRHGFTTENHRMELYGRCAPCRAAGRASSGARDA